MNDALANVDEMVNQLLVGLAKRNLTDIINIVLVSGSCELYLLYIQSCHRTASLPYRLFLFFGFANAIRRSATTV